MRRLPSAVERHGRKRVRFFHRKFHFCQFESDVGVEVGDRMTLGKAWACWPEFPEPQPTIQELRGRRAYAGTSFFLELVNLRWQLYKVTTSLHEEVSHALIPCEFDS